MTRKRETAGRRVLPGAQGKREAHGAVFDGLWNEVIVGTEAFEDATNLHCPWAGLGSLALLFSNGGLIFISLVATVMRIYEEAIRMPNACTKP